MNIMDPAHLAQMDQVQAAFRTWSECLHMAQIEVMKQGVSQETALEIARDWVGFVIAAAAAHHE